MGRNKLPIKYIEDKKRRTVIKNKRKHGLLKKAVELSIVGNQMITVSIFDPDYNRMIIYNSHSELDHTNLNAKVDSL